MPADSADWRPVETTAAISDTSEFVWVKKKLRDQKLSHHQTSSQNNPEDIKKELERLKRRRIEREEDLNLREEERVQAQREADRAQFGDWESREDQFQLRQTKNRAEIRYREGRARSIDKLALSLLLATSSEDRKRLMREGIPTDPLDPHRIFDRASPSELRSMIREIELYSYLDSEEIQSTNFWKQLLFLCNYSLAKANIITKDQSCSNIIEQTSALARISPSVFRDIEKMLGDLSHSKLVELEKTVRDKFDSEDVLDVEYWEAMLDAILAWQARLELSTFREDLAKKCQKTLKEIEKEDKTGKNGPKSSNFFQQLPQQNENPRPASPTIVQEIYKSTCNTWDDNNEEAEDADFAVEVECKRSYSWGYKYRPRKPKYSNRVITGYEWTKYNQKHYDVDNPPPKVVQGYKFNIFYPDLLHRSTAPTYRIEAKAGSPDTRILRFISSAPYEDIAFEIVNREWEISYRKGYRCVFDRGVLQLHFSFRRFFYRK